MKKSELPLYLKNSSIYNKILQLAIAVICIVVLLQILITSQSKQAIVIEDYFYTSSDQKLEQASTALKMLIAKNDKTAIDNYLTALSAAENIVQVKYYDHTGRLLASSENAASVRELLITEKIISNAPSLATFVDEIRTPELVGYLQITFNEKLATEPLLAANYNVHETMRLIALFAVIIGFLLTRGFSRYSRHGFRVVK